MPHLAEEGKTSVPECLPGCDTDPVGKSSFYPQTGQLCLQFI